jgi:hypothetical protein
VLASLTGDAFCSSARAQTLVPELLPRPVLLPKRERETGLVGVASLLSAKREDEEHEEEHEEEGEAPLTTAFLLLRPKRPCPLVANPVLLTKLIVVVVVVKKTNKQTNKRTKKRRCVVLLKYCYFSSLPALVLVAFPL